jgi:hypothetical protein
VEIIVDAVGGGNWTLDCGVEAETAAEAKKRITEVIELAYYGAGEHPRSTQILIFRWCFLRAVDHQQIDRALGPLCETLAAAPAHRR